MKILLINQAFYPDCVATAQQLTDLALALKKRGHDVRVLAGSHGYDDPSKKFQSKELYKGILVERIPYTALGKGSRAARAVDFAAFYLGLLFRLLAMPKHDVVIALTSPPLIAAAGAFFCLLKGGRLVNWVMDLNPDEAIAAGWLKERSFAARLLTKISCWTFKRCNRIIALDLFMKEKIMNRCQVESSKITVVPPWAHETGLSPVPHETNPFRRAHALDGKFVVMYSGNHSPCHPLDTVLEAARILKDEPEILFYFIGGGSLVTQVRRFAKEHALKNIVQLPYQPIDKLSESLSAADAHAVVMGAPFVGILHPSKIYGILGVGRPFIFVGPRQSHIGEVIRLSGAGRQVDHGDAAGFAEEIQRLRRMPDAEKSALAGRERAFLEKNFSQNALMAEVMAVVERSAGA